ncbi:MAG: peptidoglycan DD-metalloendopeptidase family protein [Rhodospirillaceae bacterium]|nr:peptidoglycan DD-metalloendopeptidase family protein [Rhodospirillaceae bacterium]
MNLSSKIFGAVFAILIFALAAFSGRVYLDQQAAKKDFAALEKRLDEVSANEKDTAKEVARLLSEFDANNKKQAIESALRSGAPPKFQLPLGCTPGVDCWIFNYVDADGAADSHKDYTCGNLTYDKHKGVDFAIRDLAVMKTGVPVFVAAPGQIVGVRDGMPDVNFRKVAPEIFKRRECGNGVRISHGGNWFTQYCHMKKNSIIVKKGDRVEAGKAIGFVGLSGKTEFPHLHFQVSKGKQIIDPFIGVKRSEKCRAGEETLWDETTKAMLSYQNLVIYNGGFNDQRPLADGIHRGLYKKSTLFKSSLKLFLWFAIRNTKQDDEVVLRLLGPDGKEIGGAKNTIKKAQARGIQILDVTSQGAWPVGNYRGEITLTRKGLIGDQTFRARRRITIK